MQNLPFGLFIVIEGLDRSGKTSLVNSLYAGLVKIYPTEKISFPDRSTSIGSILDKYLKGIIQMPPETIHLLFTADRYEKKLMIENTRKDTVILCDRYSWSGIASTVAKGVDIGWCIETERLLPKADITFYLNADVELISKRRGFGDEVLETKELQTKMRDVFLQMKDNGENVVMLDARKSIDEITAEALDEIAKCFRNKTLEKLV